MAQDSFIAKLTTATAQQARAILDAAVKAGAGPETVVAAAAQRRLAPGVERWAVKVGTDEDVSQIATVIVDSSVRELGALPRPADLLPATAMHDDYNDKRAGPVETTVWRVKVRIIALRLEQDGDYHLVLQDDSGATMVAEVPLPNATNQPPFVPASSPFFKDIQASRTAVDGRFQSVVAATQFMASIANNDAKLVPVGTFSAAAASPQRLDLTTMAAPDATATFATRIDPTPATITGVGFFDYDHGQTGNSPNILELHPVLSVDFTP